MPMSSARIKTMFGDCFASWTLTAATSRQAAKIVIFMFLSFQVKSMGGAHARYRAS